VSRIRYAWSRCFIGAAIEVHRLKGPGLVEPICRKCVRRECKLRNIPTRYELIVPIEYKSFVFEEPLRLDLLIDDCLIVELKAVVRNHRSTTESIDQKPF
jgi:GxxExxY protein